VAQVSRCLGNRKVGGKVRIRVQPLQALQVAHGTLFPWVPVFMAVGIGIWFALPWEPGMRLYVGLSAAGVLTMLGMYLGPHSTRPLAVMAGCVILGVISAGVRAHLVSAPVLGFRYYGPIEGRVIDVDRSQGDQVRMTLDRVVLDRLSPARTPEHVRISLHNEKLPFAPEPGVTVILTGHLTAPPGPSEPGGFDFRRVAYFEGLGAVGFTTAPVLVLSPPKDGEERINRLRAWLSAAIMARIPGQAGAFASGAVTGDRSSITQATVQDLRNSNLSHLLAISGMNMAFISAFVFALVRYGLALIPPLALRVNSKKIAAVVSMLVAAFYLVLSGANVATERAFVMVMVMLGAVLFDRRALTMRSVAISATILLILQPESLLSPGFQMSFAATIALIAAFAALDRAVMQRKVPRWVMPVFTLVLSSVVAGAATAPLGAAHFNRFTDYGLVANLLTVPAMGLLIMPGSVIATLLAPVGLEGIGLWAMEIGSRWILFVAHLVAGWEGAVSGIPAPGPWVLPIMSLGALWVILWQGRARVIGIVPVVVAFGFWIAAERPPLLVSGDGALVGMMGPEGRVMSSSRGAGFAAKSWLEDDGDLADQERAAAREGFDGPKPARRFTFAGWSVVHLKGKGALAALGEACAMSDLVILSVEVEVPPEGCRVIDRAMLAGTGTVALWPEKDGTLRVEVTESVSRLWSRTSMEPPEEFAHLQRPVAATGLARAP
jgi:competence protein ComEC